MKWFHHDIDTRRDDKIFELIEAHGMIGYGLWWLILEELYAAEKTGFQIEATDTWFKRIAKQANLSDWRSLIRVLDTMADQRLIDSQLWADHIIFCQGIMNRADGYIQKKRLNAKRQETYRQKNKTKEDDLSPVGNALVTHYDHENNALVTHYNRDVTLSETDPDPDSNTNTKADPYLQTQTSNAHGAGVRVCVDASAIKGCDEKPQQPPENDLSRVMEVQIIEAESRIDRETQSIPAKISSAPANLSSKAGAIALTTQSMQSTIKLPYSPNPSDDPMSRRFSVRGSWRSRLPALNAALDAYNQFRPAGWGSSPTKVSTTLYSNLDKLWQHFCLEGAEDPDRELIECMIHGLTYLGTTKFYTSEQFESKNLTWLLASKDRLIQFADNFRGMPIPVKQQLEEKAVQPRDQRVYTRLIEGTQCDYGRAYSEWYELRKRYRKGKQLSDHELAWLETNFPDKQQDFYSEEKKRFYNS